MFFFFANTVHFVTFEWSVNHCDPEWFYSPVHLWLLSFFFSCTDNWGHLFNFLHVLSGIRLCFTKKPFCYFICLICMAVSNLIKCSRRKCYKSILTPCTVMPVLPFFMSFTIIVTYPCACLHVFFFIPNFSLSVLLSFLTKVLALDVCFSCAPGVVLKIYFHCSVNIISVQIYAL